ncbi:hypothetical protein FA95DRAFT_1565113 [Auriscalpium vulgare]|uniref:Uncharacterized protein n=1 Tax=Auriscalpium vulgare TaxID=40419 RepID=A0ACB8RDT3_9AGAM|nr:hypothetical protein FA95DRAFT_1565113 [Auriscalpium vulgare]
MAQADASEEPFAGDLLIKRKRKRHGVRKPVDPCLGYYAPPSSEPSQPTMTDDSDVFATALPSSPAAHISRELDDTTHPRDTPPSQPPIACLPPSAPDDSDDPPPLTVHEFLQRSAGEAVKKYSRRRRVTALLPPSTSKSSPAARESTSAQDSAYTPGSSSSDPRTPSPQPMQASASIRPRRKAAKPLAQRLLEADVYSCGTTQPRPDPENTSTRRPLSFRSAMNVSPTPAAPQKRKWSLVDPATRRAALASAAFGSVGSAGARADRAPASEAQPVTAWNGILGRLPAPHEDYDEPEPGAKRRWAHAMVAEPPAPKPLALRPARRPALKPPASRTSLYAPLNLVPFEDYEAARKRKAAASQSVASFTCNAAVPD